MSPFEAYHLLNPLLKLKGIIAPNARLATEPEKTQLETQLKELQKDKLLNFTLAG